MKMSTSHPNWVGLATANIKWKLFVRSSEKDSETLPQSQEITNNELDGDKIKEFYDETLQETETLSKRKIKRKRKRKVIIKDSDDSDIELCDPEADNNFLIAVQEDDLINAQKYYKMGVNVNCRDRFNWTALMVGAGAGSVRCVNFLLKKGAITDVFNEKGLDAHDLSIKSGHAEIASIIGSHEKRRNRLKTEIETIEIPDTEYETCSQCGIAFDKDEKSAHIASTVHLMTAPGPAKSNPGFGISSQNTGFRLMEKAGWDGQSGLGSAGKGNKFPVKTVLKRDRKGLAEGDRKGARVTHFKANDEESVVRLRDVRWRRKAKDGNYLPNKGGGKKVKGNRRTAKDCEFREELAGL